MPTLRVYGAAVTSAPTLRVYGGSLSGSAAASRVLRIHNATVSGSAEVRVRSMPAVPSVEPGTPLTTTATLAAGAPGTITWAWTQVSGPTVTLTTNGAQVSFAAPSVMPADNPTVVLGVTATIGGTTSAQVTTSFTILPQTRWAWSGSAWVGAT